MVLILSDERIPIADLDKILPESMARMYQKFDYRCPSCQSFYINQVPIDPSKPDEVTLKNPNLVQWGCPECGFKWYKAPKKANNLANVWGKKILPNASLTHSSSNPHWR